MLEIEQKFAHADFDAIAHQRRMQGDDEESSDRSRLALQGVVHDGR